jgi:hypothetical protein
VSGGKLRAAIGKADRDHDQRCFQHSRVLSLAALFLVFPGREQFLERRFDQLPELWLRRRFKVGRIGIPYQRRLNLGNPAWASRTRRAFISATAASTFSVGIRNPPGTG